MINQIFFKCLRLQTGPKGINKTQTCEVRFLHIFVGFILKIHSRHMAYNYTIKRQTLFSCLAAFFLMFVAVSSQAQDCGAWGDDDSNDSDTTEKTDDDGGWGGDWGGDFGGDQKQDKGTPPKPIKAYERIDFIPIDTLTKLITYTEVHDVENNCEYCTADSLYFRAKKYLLEKYGDGKKFPKDWIIEDTENQRIILKVRLPMMAQVSPSVNRQIGFYEYKFQLWIRDYAYKYKFTNIVHLDPVVAGKPNTFNETYMEYYTKNQKKVRFSDSLLMAVDKDMKALIADIIRVMKDPVTVDIDEEDF